MDESPSKAASSVKEEKTIEISNNPVAFSWEKNIKSFVPSCHSSIYVDQECTKTWAKTPNDFLPADERRADVRCLTSEELVDDKPFGRRRSQREIAIIRECKKLELLWKNRGLPVDKESLRSAACKDPFDLKDMSRSLPSTSADEVPEFSSDIARLKWRMLQEGPQSWLRRMKQCVERMEALQKIPLASYIHRRDLFRNERLPASETKSDVGIDLRESVMNDVLQRAQRWSRWKRMHSLASHGEPDKELNNDEQKEASKERGNSNVENVLQNWAHKGPEAIRDPNVCSEFAGMSLDEKLEEKGEESPSSDAKNSRGSVVLAPLTDLPQTVGQGSSWDSKRPWTTNFAAPDLRVPLKSPIKKGKNGYYLSPDMKEKFEKLKAAIDQQEMWSLRERSKFRTLNRHRGVLASGDIDFSEGEGRLEETIRPSSADKAVQELCLTNIKVCKQMMMNLRESVKTFRSFKSCGISLGGVRSDKTMSD